MICACLSERDCVQRDPAGYVMCTAGRRGYSCRTHQPEVLCLGSNAVERPHGRGTISAGRFGSAASRMGLDMWLHCDVLCCAADAE